MHLKRLTLGLGLFLLGGCFFFLGSCAYAQEIMLKDIDSIPPSCRESKYGPGDWLRSMRHGGRNRKYIVHVPQGYDSSRRHPVVLMFHGGGGTALGTREYPGWDELADQKGFIAVYPDGAGFLKRKFHTFNAGSCCGHAMKKKVDDVGFAAALLDELARTFCIDTRRVYATGFSNGAMMSYRLACELSHRIAAIGPVAGTLGIDNCRPSRPVSLMHVHGTADPYEPYQGGKGEKSFPFTRHKTVFRSVDETLSFWIQAIGASPKPTATVTKGASVMETYGPGRKGSEVVLLKIRGGGHSWPGAKNMPGGWWLGKPNQDVSATHLLWEFFMRHPLE